jgi:galactose mutarotase-like enzyme
MEYKIGNDKLQVVCSTCGAELLSVKTPDGHEYMWQGDPAFWGSHAPQLFPLVGRLTDGKYTMDGKTYSMGTHGFFRRSEIPLGEQMPDSLTFVQNAEADTLKMYPRLYRASVRYELRETTLKICFSVQNQDRNPMYFGYGGHPGFFVPMDEQTKFEDYWLEFSPCCEPYAIGMSDDCFVEGADTRFPLQDSCRLQLQHSLFDRDAVILRDIARSVTLKSRKTKRFVTLKYPQMRFLGIWHKPHVEAPYVCIEPWTSLPARKGITESVETRSDLIYLAPFAQYTNEWSITFG